MQVATVGCGLMQHVDATVSDLLLATVARCDVRFDVQLEPCAGVDDQLASRTSAE
eukprot:CAMPEP_0183830286 /NCGR_PEP_ID=MMETSP0807_2-20130328/3936_1 /TAXON_ID=88271 /ORGANISM="Picocystis salinarum, Strain CCMP1897" /LENGTH=54 /DNA_ID=CAMNT_0026075643 /DNA_START=31 /DNA_END=192 /DNA_ORIENTATION=-